MMHLSTKTLPTVNNRTACNYRKLKCQNLISKTYTINDMVHLISNHIKIRKLVKVLQMKTPLDLFPDVEFEANNNEEEDVNES